VASVISSQCRSNRSENYGNVAPRNYRCNHFVEAGDDNVTGDHHISPCHFKENIDVHDTPIPPITLVSHLSANSSRFATKDLELNMRWLVHVLVRLTIAATCTNSAAAIDRKAEHGEHLSFSSNLLEHLMPRSFESLKGVARPHDVSNYELPAELCDSSSLEENTTRAPQFDSSDKDLSLGAVSPIDRAFAALLSSFAEGFTLFAMAHVYMTPDDESYPTEAKAGQLEEVSARERPKSLTIVSWTQPEVTKSELESGAGRTRPRLEALSPDASLAERSNARNWLARSWSAIVNRWEHWRREREIKKAVAPLLELDDRTLRDIGIPDRSQIEHAARYSKKGLI
jgi:uncharacterized protein YjiS (DUF1127 family)